MKTYTFNLGKSNGICEIKHAVILKSVNLRQKKFGRQPIKLSRKKTTAEKDVSLNEALIKICLEAVEKYVAQFRKGSFTYQCLKIEKPKFVSIVIIEEYSEYSWGVNS